MFKFNYFGSTISAQSVGIINVPPVSKTLSAHCVPVTEDGKIIAIDIIDRGVDIPGGRIENGETALEAMAREAYEEALIVVKQPVLIDVWKLSSENDTLGLKEKPYLLVYAAKVEQIDEFVTSHNEASERLILKPNAFIARYFGDKGQAKAMVVKALNALK